MIKDTIHMYHILLRRFQLPVNKGFLVIEGVTALTQIARQRDKNM